MDDVEYGGFWIRVGASLIDTVLLLLVFFPLLSLLYGTEYWKGESLLLGWQDFMFNYLLPAVIVVLFWVYRSATPGKLMLKLRIVDAKTGNKPSVGQFMGRYLAITFQPSPSGSGCFGWLSTSASRAGTTNWRVR